MNTKLGCTGFVLTIPAHTADTTASSTGCGTACAGVTGETVGEVNWGAVASNLTCTDTGSPCANADVQA